MQLPELLAPVGTWEALVAAVENGANAVYLGGKMFSARQYAGNFDREELCKAMDFAHVRGVKVFVTVNTLLFQDELAGALEYLKFLYEAGADAVILQDLGVARLARGLLPDLELHASTQMTIHNAPGAQFLAGHGFKRVVLARELSLAEIRQIKEEAPVELEVFIHGALCFSYSGQCLMSSLIGGRSGNRGRCAQPCRLKYELVDREGCPVDREPLGQHLLSPKDLWTIHHLPQLVRAGVASLKIEGRMKRPEYVATVVRIYRQALDRCRENPDLFAVTPEEEKELRQIFNRDFTTGYFFGNPGADLISYLRPNNRGLKLGRITGYNPRTGEASLLLEEDLHQGDGLEIWVSQGGRVGAIVHRMKVGGQPVEEARAGTTVTLEIPGKIRAGDRVFKTLDARLVARARETFTSAREQRKIPLKVQVEAAVGQPLTLALTDPEGHRVEAATGFVGVEALKRPLDEDTLYSQLDRLGNTPFTMGEFAAEIRGKVMIPVSEVNEVRRRAVEGLLEKRLQPYRRQPLPEPEFSRALEAFLSKGPGGPRPVGRGREGVRLTVAVGDLASLAAAVRAGADVVYFGSEKFTARHPLTPEEIDRARDLCHSGGTQLVFTTPRILEEEGLPAYLPLLDKLAAVADHGLMVANPGLLKLVQEKGVNRIYGDFPLNIFNGQTIAFLAGEGCGQVTLSPELTLAQVGQLASLAEVPVECLIHGALPMMVSRHCIVGSCLGGKKGRQACRGACGTFQGGLRDRLKMVFPVACDEYCHQYIFNPKELCMIEDLPALIGAGVTNLRIEARKESADYIKKVVRIYRKELDRYLANPERYGFRLEIKEELEALSPAGLTKGHYYRGVE